MQLEDILEQMGMTLDEFKDFCATITGGPHAYTRGTYTPLSGEVLNALNKLNEFTFTGYVYYSTVQISSTSSGTGLKKAIVEQNMTMEIYDNYKYNKYEITFSHNSGGISFTIDY